MNDTIKELDRQMSERIAPEFGIPAHMIVGGIDPAHRLVTPEEIALVSVDDEYSERLQQRVWGHERSGPTIYLNVDPTYALRALTEIMRKMNEWTEQFLMQGANPSWSKIGYGMFTIGRSRKHTGRRRLRYASRRDARSKSRSS